MNKILSIANKKIGSGFQRLLEGLASDYEAMLRRHSADGMLRSGNTVKRAMNLVSACADSLRDLITVQSQWVVDESIYVPESIADELMDIAAKYFDELSHKAEEYIQKAAEISGNPSVFDRVYPEVSGSVERSYGEAKLNIEASVASNRSRGIKGVAKYFLSIVSKLWGG